MSFPKNTLTLVLRPCINGTLVRMRHVPTGLWGFYPAEDVCTSVNPSCTGPFTRYILLKLSTDCPLHECGLTLVSEENGFHLLHPVNGVSVLCTVLFKVKIYPLNSARSYSAIWNRFGRTESNRFRLVFGRSKFRYAFRVR